MKRVFKKKELNAICDQIDTCVKGMDEITFCSLIVTLDRIAVLDLGDIKEIDYERINDGAKMVSNFLSYIKGSKLADVTDDMICNLMQIRGSVFAVDTNTVLKKKIDEENKNMSYLICPNNGEIN